MTHTRLQKHRGKGASLSAEVKVLGNLTPQWRDRRKEILESTHGLESSSKSLGCRASLVSGNHRCHNSLGPSPRRSSVRQLGPSQRRDYTCRVPSSWRGVRVRGKGEGTTHPSGPKGSEGHPRFVELSPVPKHRTRATEDSVEITRVYSSTGVWAPTFY